jgi:hypothetical protein
MHLLLHFAHILYTYNASSFQHKAKYFASLFKAEKGEYAYQRCIQQTTYQPQLSNVLLQAKLQELYTKVSQSTAIEYKELTGSCLETLLKTKIALGNPTPDGNQYLMGVAFHRHSESSTKTKISNLEYPFILVHQQVLWLQIPINKFEHEPYKWKM